MGQSGGRLTSGTSPKQVRNQGRVLAAVALAMALSTPFPGTAEDPAIKAWGDRFYAYGDSEDMPVIRTEVEENFDAETGWFCSMSQDEGFGAVRRLASGEGHVLGLKVEFLRRSSSSLLLSPAKPILVDSRCAMLSVRALGRNLRHRLSFVVLDYYGRAYELPLGRLNFSGWKKLQAYVPRPDPTTGTGIVQDDGHFSRPAGLRIAGLRIDFDPEEAFGSFYAYFDDIEATIEGYGPVVATTTPPVTEPAPLPPIEAPTASNPPTAPVAVPAVDPVKESSRILSELSARIGKALFYPAAARRRGLEGTLVAAFTVDSRGNLVGARVATSSGSDILDAAGLDLLKTVFPVVNDSGKQLELRIAIGYRLSGTGP